MLIWRGLVRSYRFRLARFVDTSITDPGIRHEPSDDLKDSESTLSNANTLAGPECGQRAEKSQQNIRSEAVVERAVESGSQANNGSDFDEQTTFTSRLKRFNNPFSFTMWSPSSSSKSEREANSIFSKFVHLFYKRNDAAPKTIEWRALSKSSPVLSSKIPTKEAEKNAAKRRKTRTMETEEGRRQNADE